MRRPSRLRKDLTKPPCSGERGLAASRVRSTWFALVIIAVTAAVYADSLSGVFLLDDIRAIVDNPQVRRLWPLTEALKAPPQSTLAGRPLVSLSLALSHAISGLQPWGYHVFNVAVHILASLVLFGLVRRTLRRDVALVQSPITADNLALTAALIWAVHPLQTESVTYVVQRAESMMGLFYLLTLYCFARGCASTRSWRWFTAAVISCALGMCTKEVMATAPVAVLLYDAAFVSGLIRGALARHWRSLGALAATWLVLAGMVASGPRSQTAGFGLEAAGPWAYGREEFLVVLHYLRLVFWPRPLCLDYDWRTEPSVVHVAMSAAAIMLLLVASLWAWRWKRGVGFLGISFFLILAPSSSIVPINDLAFEHRMYLPLAAVVILGVLAGWKLLDWGREGSAPARRLHRLIPTLAVLTVLLLLAAATVLRNQDYGSALTMWRGVVRTRPDNARAQCNLGLELARQGDSEDAIAAYQRALLARPDYAMAHYNLANALSEQGRIDEAIEQYRAAILSKPSYAEAHINLGAALAGRNRLDEAILEFQAALDGQVVGTETRSQVMARAYMHLGNAQSSKGAWGAAVAAYGEAARLRPDYYRVHFNLALALQNLNRIDEAVEQYKLTLQLQPDHEAARKELEKLQAVRR